MTSRNPGSPKSTLGRRQFLQVAAAAPVAAAAIGSGAHPAAAQDGKIVAEEHWAKKGPVDLYLYRKRMVGDGSAAKPVLFLVHGSTFSCRGSYDLQVPGRSSYSLMDHFAGLGFDVWSMDHEGYGHSSRTASHAGIHGRRRGPEGRHAGGGEGDGAKPSVLMHGQSSGAIRAGAFAVAEPARVERLSLARPHLHRRELARDRAPPQGRRPLPGQPAPADQPRLHPAHLRSRQAGRVGAGGAEGACRLRAQIRQRGAERHLPRHGRQHADGRSREARVPDLPDPRRGSTATPARRSCCASMRRCRTRTSSS